MKSAKSGAKRNDDDDDDDDGWYDVNDDDDQNGFIHTTSHQNINFSLCERAKPKLTLLVKAEHDANLKTKKQKKKHGAKVNYVHVHVQERINQYK